jgi:hypothetical protein
MLAVLADSFVSTRPGRSGRLIRLGGAQHLIKSPSLMIR